MTPKHRNIFMVLLGLSLLSFLGLMLTLPRLPERIPIHWNFAGEVDGYGGKGMLILCGGLPIALVGLLWALPKWDPGRERYKKHMGPYLFLAVMVTMLMIAAGWSTALAGLGIRLPVGRIIPGLMGVMLMGLGNYMPRIRHNYTFGIRTPWTLASETVWRKTHRAGGYGFIAGGLLLILTAVFQQRWLMWGSMGALLLSAAFSLWYSWYLYQKEGSGNEKGNG